MRSNPGKPNQAQEAIMIQDLQRVVQLNEIQAREILTLNSWNLQKATNIVLDIQNKGARIDEQYSKYASKNSNLIEAEGITAFCAELGIDIMDPIILYISYIFKSETMGVYTKFDFLFGFNILKCQSTIDLRKIIPNLRNELSRKETLKQVYKFCFDFSKQKNRKDIDIQIAQGLWDTLLKKNYPIMTQFLEFVNQIKEQDKKPISRDTYYMVWEFCEQFGQDLSKYDYKTGAWPTFLDSFFFYIHPELKSFLMMTQEDYNSFFDHANMEQEDECEDQIVQYQEEMQNSKKDEEHLIRTEVPIEQFDQLGLEENQNYNPESNDYQLQNDDQYYKEHEQEISY